MKRDDFTAILDNINSPKDLKKLNNSELEQLCCEIRQYIVETVSQTGGHLASNLGVVELTVALHKVFNSPNDQMVFDVGHQCYTHKILTGRKDAFKTLRTENGISGFTRPVESEHDIFSSGHSSVSVSQALGLAKAKEIKGEKGKVIAIIGDGSLTGGLAYEALNSCDDFGGNLIVIVNDNNMSISQNIGTMSKHLTTVRTSKEYFTFKSRVRRALSKMPKLGAQINRFITYINGRLRRSIYYNATFFEDLGFRYYGPIDGHDIESLISALETAKAHTHPVLVHINTVKGKGYAPAEQNPTQFHGIGKFDIETGKPLSGGDNFSSAFGKTLCELAAKDSRICCITAAMAEGTGLSEFASKYPNRFFDVGIAEQHAVTFASGLAKNGMVPVFAVYSTFLQRAYDQLIHDVAMQGLKIIFGVDRAGFVGEDGESHQGIFDVSYLNTVPDMNIYAPADYNELALMLGKSIYHDKGAVAIRYPRGGAESVTNFYNYDKADFAVIGDSSKPSCIVCYGREFQTCYEALEQLDDAFLIKINRIKPLNPQIVDALQNAKHIYFFEESIKSGSVGSVLSEMLEERGVSASFKHIAIIDEFVKQASVSRQIEIYGMDRQSVINEVLNGEENKA